MKKVFLAILLSLSLFAAFAQERAPGNSAWADPLQHPMLPVYAIGGVMLIVMLLLGVTGILMIRMLNMLAEEAERQKASRAGVPYVQRSGWWSRFSQRANASIPLDQEQSIQLDHDYDGIKELDNHLPPWWKWLFYGTIAWSAVYLFVYHVSGSYPLMIQEYLSEVNDAEATIRKIKAAQPQESIDEDGLAYTADADFIMKGSKVFVNMNCGSCHRGDGGGNAIGPNLTDDYWIHGGDIRQVFNTIKNGAVEKGMPAWGNSLSPQDVRNVTFFVLSLQGSNPPNAKAPQGEKHAAQPTDAGQASL